MENFAKEVHETVTSPIWELVPRRAGKRLADAVALKPFL